MKITALQAHVLANLNRVVTLSSRIGAERRRYQLDGIECTFQIASLAARKVIGRHPSGGFKRLQSSTPRKENSGERQKPLATSIEQIRAALYAPGSVRAIGSKTNRPVSAART